MTMSDPKHATTVERERNNVRVSTYGRGPSPFVTLRLPVPEAWRGKRCMADVTLYLHDCREPGRKRIR